MVDSRLFKPWLKKADDDFNFASTYLKDEKKFYSQICFFFSRQSRNILKHILLLKSCRLEKSTILESF